MNEINFLQGKNYYHTYNEMDIVTKDNVVKGSSIITGYTKVPIENGDALKMPQGIHFVTEVLERRNHAGDFSNSEDRVNGFFKVNCSFERIANNTK